MIWHSRFGARYKPEVFLQASLGKGQSAQTIAPNKLFYNWAVMKIWKNTCVEMIKLICFTIYISLHVTHSICSTNIQLHLTLVSQK